MVAEAHRGPLAEARSRGPLVAAAWVLALTLPLAGLVSLPARSRLDPHWTNPRVPCVLFLPGGAVDFALAYAAGDAARRRGDARVLLISLAFLATGGFLGLHAIGTPGILFERDLSGFKAAIPFGLLVAAVFAVASAFVDVRPDAGRRVVRRRVLMRRLVFAAMALWFFWTVTALPPLHKPGMEAATGHVLPFLAAGGAVVYGVAALRYYGVYREQPGLLPASVIACFVLLGE